MDAESAWRVAVDAAVLVWTCLFAVSMAVVFGLVTVASDTLSRVRTALRWLLLVSVLDAVVLYRQSDRGPLGFLRANWLRVLTVVPWGRPLRLLRIGRGVRAARSRRVGGLLFRVGQLDDRVRGTEEEKPSDESLDDWSDESLLSDRGGE